MFGSSRNSEPTPPAVPPSAPPRLERTDDNSSRPRPRAVLSSDVSIKGDVTFINELLVDGEVEGTINSSGTLTVGEHARIRGEIRTKSVIVRGKIEGDVFASERCVLEPGGVLHGDVEAPRFGLAENASFRGSARIAVKRS